MGVALLWCPGQVKSNDTQACVIFFIIIILLIVSFTVKIPAIVVVVVVGKSRHCRCHTGSSCTGSIRNGTEVAVVTTAPTVVVEDVLVRVITVAMLVVMVVAAEAAAEAAVVLVLLRCYCHCCCCYCCCCRLVAGGGVIVLASIKFYRAYSKFLFAWILLLTMTVFFKSVTLQYVLFSSVSMTVSNVDYFTNNRDSCLKKIRLSFNLTK